MSHPLRRNALPIARPARGLLSRLGQVGAVCLLAVALAACGDGLERSTAAVSGGPGAGQPAYGGISAHAVWPAVPAARPAGLRSGRFAALPAQVATVRVIVSAPDLDPPIQRDFDASLHAGVVDHIPVGMRTLTLQGLDGSSTALYEGAVSGVLVEAGVTTDAGTVELQSLAPATAPGITTPGSPYVGNTAPLTLAGTCIDSPPHTVHLAGPQTDSTPCTNGAFSFTLADPGADGAYEYTLTQTRDDNGLASPTATFAWTLDRAAPAAPALTSPAGTSVTNADSTLVLTGTCENGTTVSLGGDGSDSAVCAGGAFSFTVSAATDGTRTYQVTQTDPAGNASATASVQWIRDTVVPAVPAIATPASSPRYTNDAATAFTVAGTCTGSPAHTVHLGGDATDSQACSGAGTYSFTVPNPGTDASYTYTVTQTRDATGLGSGAATATIVLDTGVPAAPGVSTPGSNPVTTPNSSLAIGGLCETGTAVALGGDATDNQTCSGGGYSFTVNAGADGTYNYTVTQTDLAGNASPAAAVQWVRDTTMPGPPTIGTPGGSPSYTNDAVTAYTIAGTCTGSPAHTVHLGGDATDNQACSAGGTYSFSVTNPGSDGSSTYTVTQTRDANGLTSGGVSATIVLDTGVPAAPAVSTPGSSPVTTPNSSLTLSGSCEAGATVNLGGDGSGSQACGPGFSFTVNAASDGTRTYAITQSDAAGNTSPAANVQWVRDTTVPGVPTIGTPAASPSYTNDAVTAFTIAGTCTGSPAHTVHLGGDATDSQACSGGAYSFSVTNPGSDGSYSYTVTQTRNANGLTSSADAVTIVLDTGVPVAPGVSSPASNPVTTAGSSLTLSGSCEAGATVNLGGDATDSQACAGGYSFTVNAASDGTYDYSLTQTDAAGNTSSAAGVQWVRDTTVPGAPSIGTPASSPSYTNDSVSPFGIAGSCTGSPAHTVTLGGDATDSQACTAGNTYSFSIANPGSDGSYTYTVTQTRDANGQTSTASSATIVLDTATPAAPGVSSPASSPYTSAGSSLVISGGCEANATVNLGGDATDSQACAGGYSFTVNAASDGTYNYSLTQTDRAGNTSAAAAVQWVRDSTVPGTPTIGTPASSPTYTNDAATAFTVAGTCTGSPAHTVNLGGDATDSQACSGGTYSFSITNPATDGSYTYSVTQTRDANGLTSGSVSATIVLDTGTPAAPGVSSPASSPVTTAGSSLTISGGCEANATVDLGGDATGSQACAGGYSFTVNAASDGTYNYALTQTDRAGNTSAAANVQWVRDTTVPAAPGLTSPASTPHHGNTVPLVVSGTCISSPAHTVNLSGTQSGSVACASGMFSFSLSDPGSDGTYGYTFTQTRDATGLTSSSTTLSWVLDRNAPAAPGVTSPASSPITTTGNSLTISGGCEANATVNLSGDATGSQACAGGYSFTVNAASDGTYNYALTQTDQAGNTSAAANVQWVRDTVVPSAPTIGTPASSPSYTNDAVTAYTIAGTCLSSPVHTVTLGGDATATQACSGGTYSFSVTNPGTDGSTTYTVTQTRDANGNTSSAASVTIVLDTGTPAAPVVTSPASSPATTTGSSLTISGNCEANATVNLGGDATGSQACGPGFSFTVNAASDGTYNYSITQTDRAGNTSAAATQQWVRDTVVPSAPTIGTPASSPSYTNDAVTAYTIAGLCTATPAHTVNLSGGATDSQTCSGGAYSFSVTNPGTDGSTTYNVTQTRDANGNTSSAASVTIVLDTGVPAAPTISAPASSPYVSSGASLTLSGNCEANATVTLGGDTADSQPCSGTSYSFTISPGADGTYTYTVTQTDLAGNTSAAATQVWERASTPPSAPVITSPAGNPHYGNTTPLTLSGTCTGSPAHTVTLSGTQSGTTACTGGGTFSFSLTDPGSDGSYGYTLTQTRDDTGLTSGGTAFTWNLDATAPAAPTISAPASSPYVSSSASLTLSGNCETNATVNLGGDGSDSQACSGTSYSFTISPGADGTYTYSVTQTDLAGNTSASATQVWERAVTPPSAPGIDSPASSPYYSTSGPVTLSGTCTSSPAHTVTLSGAQSGTTACSANAYSFSLSDPGSDGTYNYSVTQTRDATGLTSSATGFSWVRDNVAPAAPVIQVPAASPYVDASGSITLSGTCESGATVNLSGDATDSQACGGSFSFTVGAASNGTYNYSLTQTDGAGNTSAAATQQWVRGTPGFTVTPITLSVTEGGAAKTFDVVLDTPPSGDVVVNVVSTDTTEATVDIATLTFTTGNWSTAQTVTVTPVNDLVADGNQTASARLTVDQAATADATYDTLDPADVALTIVDNDAIGITVTPTAGLFTSEAGGTAQFTVVLNSAPNGSVAIDVSSGKPAEVLADTGQLVFTTGNWDTAQTVTLTGQDDLIADGTQAVTIALSVNPSGTADTTGYALLNPADVSVNNTDDDAIGVTVTPTSGLTTTESGGSATFSVVLNTLPDGDVVIDLGSSNYGEVNHDKTRLTFTTANWNTAQVVTVSGVDDGTTVDGNQAVTILLVMNTTLTTDTTGYDGLDPADVSVTNVDNDTLGVSTAPASGLQTDEYGATTSFTVVLDSPPDGDVYIDLASTDTGEVTIDKTQLIFTTSNWSTTQTVTAQGVNDTLTDGDIAVPVTLAVNTGLTADTTGYKSVTIPDVTVTNLDNEAFSEGAPGAPVDLGTEANLPYTGGSGTSSSSYYLVSGLTPNTTYLVTASSLTQNVTLRVYSDVDFLNQLCSSNQYSWPGPEACQAQSNTSGELYVRVTNQSGTYGSDFTIDVQLPPSSQGTSGSPVDITASLPYDGTVAGSGNSYYVVTGTGTSTWYASLTGMSEDLNLYVYTNSGFSTSTCSSTSSTIAESCNATSSADALYIRVNNTSGTPATFNLDVRSLPADEGSSASPIVLTGLLPYRGEMDGAAGSYYSVSGLVASASYTVSLTSVSKDVRLRVYSDSAFSSQLCNSDSPISSPEYCSVSANAFGQLFIRVSRGSSNSGGALYTLDVQ